MTAAIFSYCPRIIGKDKSLVKHYKDDRMVEKWTQFRNHFSNQALHVLHEDQDTIVSREFNRADAVNLIAYRGYATAYVLKDDTVKKGRSQAPNILGARITMLDFDNTMSMEEATAHPWWPKVWFAYSTPSYGKIQDLLTDQDLIKLPAHQYNETEKHVGQPKRNFRLVFKFCRFVPAIELAEVMSGFMSLFPMADTSCTDTARLFFGSPRARVEQPSTEYELSEADISELKALGAQWREDNKKLDKVRREHFASQGVQAEGDFNGDTAITLASGETLTVRQILEFKPLGWKEACFSPFRVEKSPSAFVCRWTDSGNVFVHDSGSGLKHTFKADDHPSTLTFIKRKITTEQQPEVVEAEPREVVTLVQLERPAQGPAYSPEYKLPLTEQERRAQIKLTATRLQQYNIFFAPEGFGKSFITLALSSRLRKVMFCCATNEQAEQKASEFSQLKNNAPGFPLLRKPKVQLCVSRDYLFKKTTGITVIKDESVNPFDAPVSNKSLTIEAIIVERGCKVSEAEELWELEHDGANVQSPDFSPEAGFDIIVTTMARAEIIAKSGAYRAMSDEWVVIYDDPGHSDVANLIRVTEAREARIMKINAALEEKDKPPLNITKREFDGRVYYVRPDDQRLGQSFAPFRDMRSDDDKFITVPVIYTTTEELTRFMIESAGKNVKTFDYMHDTHAMNVTLFGTSLVHRKNDGLIILAVELLRKKYPDEPPLLIGDGLGQRLNHVNNKGQNALSTQHIVIELSQLHPEKSMHLVHELQYITSNKLFTDREVQTFYMRDQMHQAIGRNSGYRGRDGNFQSIVLCDPHYWESLFATCRYMPAPWSTQLDATTGTSVRSRVNARKRALESFSFHDAMHPIVGTLRDFVRAPSSILDDTDFDEVIATVATQGSLQTKKRVIDALQTQIEKNKMQNEKLGGVIVSLSNP